MDVSKHWKTSNGLHDFQTWLHMVHCHFKSCKNYCFLPELELVGVEGDAITLQQHKSSQPTAWKKLLCKSSDQRRGSSTHFVMFCTSDLNNFIIIASPWCDESGEVTVIFMKGNTVITIQTVKKSFLFVGWYGTSLMKRGFWCNGLP